MLGFGGKFRPIKMIELFCPCLVRIGFFFVWLNAESGRGHVGWAPSIVMAELVGGPTLLFNGPTPLPLRF